jgi:hypothetical protein
MIGGKTGRVYEGSGEAKIGYLEGQLEAGISTEKGGELSVGGEAGLGKGSIKGTFHEKPDIVIDPVTGKMMIKQDTYFIKVEGKLYSVSYENSTKTGVKIDKENGLNKGKWDMTFKNGQVSLSTPWLSMGYKEIDASNGVNYFQNLLEYSKLYADTLKKQLDMLKALSNAYGLQGAGLDLRGLDGKTAIDNTIALLKSHAEKLKQDLSKLKGSIDVTKSRNFQKQSYIDTTETARNNAKGSTSSFLTNIRTRL